MQTQTLSIHELELHEAGYWSAYYLNAGLELQKKFGFAVCASHDTVCMAAPGMDILAFNRAIGAGLNNPLNRHHLKEIIDFYRTCGSSRFFLQLHPMVLTYHARELLEDTGFSHYNNWCKYYREISEPLPVPETDLNVIEVQPEQVNSFADVIRHAFEIDYDIKSLMASTYGQPGWHYFLAVNGSRPVAAASMCTYGDHAMLTLAGTLPEARNHGAQNLLIAIRVNKAIDLGCRYLSVETAEDTPEKPSPSARNIERAGFTLAYTRPNFICQF